MRLVAFALVVAWSVSPAFAQTEPGLAAPPVGGAPDKTVQRLNPPLGCEQLTVADGLPQSVIVAIAQDQLGFIWISTQEGLARYDGLRVEHYRPNEEDPTTVSASYINAITPDPSGKLWMSTEERGINLYDPATDKFTRYLKSDGLSSDGATASVRDNKDRVWFAMSGGGINRFDPKTNKFVDDTPKSLDVAIRAFDVDADGNLWLGTSTGAVVRWNPDDGAMQAFSADQLGIEAITAVRVASTKTVWIGTPGEGLVALDPASGKSEHYVNRPDDPRTLSNDHVKAIIEDAENNLWVGTTNGLNRIGPDRKIIRLMNDPLDPTSLAFPRVEALFQDRAGVIWAGGWTVGICKFDRFPQRFGYHRIRNNITTSFFEDPDGTFWVGTYHDGLYNYNRATSRVTIYHRLRAGSDVLDLETAWITAMHRDKRGTLWLSLADRGLVAFDPRTETYEEFRPDRDDANALPIDTVFDFWEDKRGSLWLATRGAGLVRFDPQSRQFVIEADDDVLGSRYLYVLHPDPKDPQVLWIGTAKAGLVRYNVQTRTASSYRHKADDPATLSVDDVTTLYIDPSGVGWAGTYGGGFNRVDLASGKIERFTTANSELTSDTIFGLLPDDDGRLWMSTNGRGLVVFDPKAKTFASYDVSDGLQDNEFNQNAYMRTKSGELLFGGARGFNAFMPKAITKDPYPPPVVLTAFKIGNQDVKLSRPPWALGDVEVSYTDSFEVQFAALSFAAPKKIRYAHKLEGYDDKFIETDRPFATYGKLDGGKYTLRVRAANRDGVWSEKALELRIAVAPPWWQTWPAFCGYLIVLAGAIFLLYRMQRDRLARAEREGRLAVVERDLELTGAVQNGFLPEVNEINTSRVQVFGFYRPAEACGGDWWWYQALPGGRHIVLVGDVTGHGPGPAMVTAAVATAFRVMIENGLDDSENTLELLNREVLRVAKGKYHMTMAALEVNELTGQWTFYSAGSPPILSLNSHGKHRVHFSPGAPLGTESGFEYGRVHGTLQPGDRLLLYTDGIPEIALPNGNQLGMRRFAQLYERTRTQPLRDAAATILMHADQSRGNGPQLDDWTFALIEWSDEQLETTMSTFRPGMGMASHG